MNSHRQLSLVAVASIAGMIASIAFYCAPSQDNQCTRIVWSGVYLLGVVSVFAGARVVDSAIRSEPVKVARAWVAFAVLMLSAAIVIFMTAATAVDYAYPILVSS